jgi:4a-hydroxytetrahydrobiopterin dehydratase
VPAALSPDEIRRSLGALPGWSFDGEVIERTFEFPDFPAAIRFVNKVAELAEQANHHPDIDIRYSKVRVASWSHDAGGVTNRDIKLATSISKLPI